MKSLNKRIIRDLKNNAARYGALFLMLALGLGVLTGMAASVDSILGSNEKYQKDTNMEDGSFTMMTELSDEQINRLESEGADIEESFYTDMPVDDGSVLRIFKMRRKINKISLTEGVGADNDDKIVIEKLYAVEKNIKVGDTINISGKNYEVCGIGCTADYNFIIRNITDVAKDVDKFSTAFISENEFDRLFNEKPENITYSYSYKLSGGLTDDELRHKLDELTFGKDNIDNIYVRELINDTESSINELTDAIDEMADGSNELYDAVEKYKVPSEFSDSAGALANGMNELYTALSSIPQLPSALSENALTLKESTDKLCEEIGKIKAPDELRDSVSSLKNGTAELREKVSDYIDNDLDIKYSNLKTFLKNDDNIRITNYEDDAKVNKSAAFMIGFFFLILVAYILSVFSSQNIERERSVIGTLYSLGYQRGEITKSFLMLPLLVVFAASVVSIGIGYLLISPLAAESTGAFSYPYLKVFLKPYIILFILIAPLLFTLVINGLIIRKKLSQEPLKLLRKQISGNTFTKADLSGMKFSKRFRLRQLFMEIKTSITLAIGIFLSILIMVLGFCVKDSIDYYIYETKELTPYEYMYIFQYPEKEPPSGSEAAYTENLKIDYLTNGKTADVSLLGVPKGSRFFNYNLPDKNNEVCISTSAVEKLNLKIGDIIYLTDNINDTSYRFTVTSVVDYANGLYMFMNLNQMRELFGQEPDYYNTCFSNTELNIEEGRLLSVITRKDLADATDLFVDQMFGTEMLLIALSVMVLIITMYLLIKLMIEKSSFSISLMKVIGYNKKEINGIYLSPGTITLIISSIISFPLSKLIMNNIFASIITNFGSGLKVYIYPSTYAVMIGIIIITYIVICAVLKYHLNKIQLTEILKNVE